MISSLPVLMHFTDRWCPDFEIRQNYNACLYSEVRNEKLNLDLYLRCTWKYFGFLYLPTISEWTSSIFDCFIPLRLLFFGLEHSYLVPIFCYLHSLVSFREIHLCTLRVWMVAMRWWNFCYTLFNGQNRKPYSHVSVLSALMGFLSVQMKIVKR